MAFNKDQFRKNIMQEKENNSNKINEFIEEFTKIIESEEFENWLQKQLEYTNKYYNELYFYMGIYYEKQNRESRFNFYISGDEYSNSDNIVYIRVSDNEYIALPKYKKEQEAYKNAMNECWKVLKQKVKTLGLTIITNEPDWQIEYKSYHRKIEFKLIDEN